MTTISHTRHAPRAAALALLAAAACGGSDDPGAEGTCQIEDAANAPDSLAEIVCQADFEALASEPLDVTLPGARSVKVVLDRQGGDTLYFQNSSRFEIHYDFVSSHLSGDGLPVVGSLADFNSTEYFSPDRRFLLGALTYYEQPQRWVLELTPYDTASAELVTQLFTAVQGKTYIGSSLAFHPTSSALSELDLPSTVPVVTTDELYAGIDYQPLSLGTAVGRLHFSTADALAAEYLSYQDIVVLDQAPNDISVVQGIVTEEFQTPLSHINVLSRNRHTTNMGLRGALSNPDLTALEGELVKLVVAADAWTVETVSQEEAEAWWADHAPEPITLPSLDLEETALRDIADVTPETEGTPLRDSIRAAVPAYGGKAAHYSILFRTDGVPIREAFAVPVYYYDQFMRENGFYDRVDALLADPTFTTDPSVRDQELATLRADMVAAPLDPDFAAALQVKVAEYAVPGVVKLRFRSSSNSEDLDGFPCAGCYNSYSGEVADPADVEEAVKKVYADVWQFRTFEERSYYGVDHRSVAMALLVHESFPDEEANGVAVTANPFDRSGLDPAFYVNVQYGGDVEVVAPPAGVTSDQVLYYFDQPNQPISYLTHSSLVAAGGTVLSASQLHELGEALAAIHARFSAAYGPAGGNDGWYAMDVEFKFDDVADPDRPATCYIKQARPYPDPWAATE